MTDFERDINCFLKTEEALKIAMLESEELARKKANDTFSIKNTANEEAKATLLQENQILLEENNSLFKENTKLLKKNEDLEEQIAVLATLVQQMSQFQVKN